MCNELDTSKFDPLLVKNVARGVAKGVEMFRERVENLVRIHADRHVAIPVAGI